MQSTGNKTIIGTQKSVYWDSKSGKLERSRLVESMLFVPHQTRFNSNSQTGFTVAVHHLTTDTLEKTVVATMPTFSHSTAVTTPFAGVVGIDNVERDILVEAPCFEVHPELIEGDTQNLTVELLALGTEPFEVFNPDVSIILQGEIGDVSYDFTHTILDEVLLVCFESTQTLNSLVTAGISETLEPALIQHNLLTPHPDVFAEVKLLQDSTFWCEDGCGETLTVHINADNVLSDREFSILLAKVSDNLTVRCESVSLTQPTSLNQRSVPLVVPILDNRNGNICFGFDSKGYEEPALGVECLAVSWLVELDGDMVENLPLRLADTTLDVADDLAVEGGVFLDN